MYDGATATPQPVAGSQTYFFGGFDLEGTSWVVGEDAAVARRVNNLWTKLNTTGTNSLYAVGGLRPDEIFAFGYFATNAGNGYLWNGSALVPTGELLPNTGTGSVIRRLLVTSPGGLFVAGANSSGPLILRGRR